MYTPVYIVLSSLAASIGIVILLALFKVPATRLLGIAAGCIAGVWLFMSVFGEFVYDWGNNALCPAYLGCTSGFFGFDAFEHLFFGMAFAFFIAWLSMQYPGHAILSGGFWRKSLSIVAIVALVAVLWEIGECAHDVFRANILHEPLRNAFRNINLLDQPSNLDTMGDLTFSLIGSILGLSALAFKRRH